MPPPVVPTWAAAATASVLQPTSKDYQIQLPDAQQMEAMGEQLLQSIVQGFMKVVDGYVLPGVEPTTQLSTWSDGITGAVTELEDFVETGNYNDLTAALNDILGKATTAGTEATQANDNWTTLLTEFGFSSTEVAQLATFWQGLSTDLDDLFSGTGTSSGSTLATWINTVTADANAGWQWIVDQFNQLAYGNATTDNPLTSITGAVQALLSNIPATSITSASESLQLVPDFPTASSLVPGAGWLYDATNGLYAAGCASYTCSGAAGTLYGNWIPVNEGDIMTPSAYAAWQGLTAGANAIALNLRTDSNVVHTVGSIATPGATSAGYTGAIAGDAGTAQWVELAPGYTYTVPAGVAFVRSELYVGASATAGTVQFDHAPDERSDSWLTAQLTGLSGDIGDIYNAFATGNQAELTAAWANLMGLLGSTPVAMTGTVNSSTFWTNIVTEFINEVDALEVQASNIVGELEQSAVTGLTDVWDFLTGTPTPTSSTQVLATKVASTLGGGSTSLGTDVAAVSGTASTQGNWWTDLETELGLTPSGSKGTAVGGVVNTQGNWWDDLMTELGLSGSGSKGTAVGGVVSTASAAASTNTSAISQIGSVLTGSSIAPVNAAVSDVVSWFSALGTQLTHVGTSGLLDAAGLTNVSNIPTLSASSIASALTGPNLGTDVTNLVDLLFNTSSTPAAGTQIQANVVPGVQGIVNSETTFQTMWDNWASATATALGLTGVASSGNSLSAATSAVSAHAQATSTALSIASASANAITGLAQNQPSWVGLVEYAQSNMPITQVCGSASQFALSNASTIGFVRASQPFTLGQVALGTYYSTQTAPAAVYVNIYRLDPATGNLVFLYATTNVLASVPSTASASQITMPWFVYTLPGPSQIAVNAGDIIAVELQIVGGHLTIAGVSNVSNASTVWANRAGVLMKNIGGSRTTPGTSPPSGNIAASAFTFSGQAPVVSLEQVTVPADYEPPVTNFYAASQAVVAPAWANHVDVIPVGGGGGGGNGLAAAGGAGGNTVVTCGSNSVTAAGGAGGTSGNSYSQYDAYGIGPGPEVVNGQSYSGGTTVGQQAQGSSPGGGGGGGANYAAGVYGDGASPGVFNPVTWSGIGGQTINITVGAAGGTTGGSFAAGNGAKGGVWLRFYQ